MLTLRTQSPCSEEAQTAQRSHMWYYSHSLSWDRPQQPISTIRQTCEWVNLQLFQSPDFEPSQPTPSRATWAFPVESWPNRRTEQKCHFKPLNLGAFWGSNNQNEIYIKLLPTQSQHFPHLRCLPCCIRDASRCPRGKYSMKLPRAWYFEISAWWTM